MKKAKRVKYSVISEVQLKVLQDALEQSEIYNQCAQTFEVRAKAEEILEMLANNKYNLACDLSTGTLTMSADQNVNV